MEARTTITFPTGVKLGEGMEVYFPQTGTDHHLRKGSADIEIVAVRAVGDREIEVSLRLSTALEATLMPKNGHGNPAVRVTIAESRPA